MTLPVLPFQRYVPSKQLVAGADMNALFNLLTSFKGSVTALAGGGRGTTTPIINDAYTEITVCATGADSVVLPPAKVGLSCYITNSGAASCQVFANGSDTINGTAGATGVALANGATAEYLCTKDGVWRRFVSA